MAKQETTQVADIPVEVEFTDGYQERFTIALLKIYEKKIRQDGRFCEKGKSA